MTEPYTNFKAGELTPWQDLSRGLKTLEGSLASLAVIVDDLRTKHSVLDGAVFDLVAHKNWLYGRCQQLTAAIEGVDAHLETVEQSQQTYDTHLETLDQEVEQLRNGYHELHSTFQASIDALEQVVQEYTASTRAKFDEYMQYVRNTSHTTISQGTRITQLETLTGQQRTMIEVALRILKDNQLEEII